MKDTHYGKSRFCVVTVSATDSAGGIAGSKPTPGTDVSQGFL